MIEEDKESKISYIQPSGIVTIEQVLDQEKAQDLICPIDQVIFKEPYQLLCSHVFCKSCIEKWLALKFTCPVCRKIAEPEYKKICEAKQNEINNLVIKCVHPECKWTGTIKEYTEQHIKTDCLYEEIECQFECGLYILRSEIEKHPGICASKNPAELQKLKDSLVELSTKNSKIHTELHENQEKLFPDYKLEIISRDSKRLIQSVISEPTENLMNYARYAQDAEQYDDVRILTTEIIKRKEPMTVELRNSFVQGYKHCMYNLRNSFRILDEEQAKLDNSLERNMKIYEQKIKVTLEIEYYVNFVLDLLSTNIFVRELSHEDYASFLKVNADFLRFSAECSVGEKRRSCALKSQEKYLEGINFCDKHLVKYAPGRLGIILNYTVLLIEFLEQKQKAIEIALNTYNEISNLINEDKIDKNIENFSDTELIIKFMKENVELWRDMA